jgi:uncharacterized protein YjbI with pentapeptide repeats
MNFDRAILNRCSFKGTKLQSVSFYDTEARYIDFTNANIRDCCFRKADLERSNFSGAKLQACNTAGAYVYNTVLEGTMLPETSHEFMAEVLRQAAGDDIEKVKVAAYIAFNENKCWSDFLAINDPLKDWAVSVVKKYVSLPILENYYI